MQWPLEVFRSHQRALVKPSLALAVILPMVMALHGCASRGEAPSTPTEPRADATPAAPAGPAWLTRATEPDFVPLSDPSGHVSIEYPKENWQSVPGTAPTLATFEEQNGGATVVLEQTKLNLALRPDEVTDVFGKIETETIKKREPNATGFETRLLEEGNRRVVAVQYQRPGAEGTEVVRQYSFPVGQTLYRLTCVMNPDELEQQESICSHMAASFTVSGS